MFRNIIEKIFSGYFHFPNMVENWVRGRLARTMRTGRPRTQSELLQSSFRQAPIEK